MPLTEKEEIDAFVAARREERRLSKIRAAAMPIDTGDHVFIKSTGETLMVKQVLNDGWFEWCGWPPGQALICGALLVYKATPAEKEKLLREISRAA